MTEYKFIKLNGIFQKADFFFFNSRKNKKKKNKKSDLNKKVHTLEINSLYLNFVKLFNEKFNENEILMDSNCCDDGKKKTKKKNSFF